jgi:hypothetical protein
MILADRCALWFDLTFAPRAESAAFQKPAPGSKGEAGEGEKL